MTDPAPRDLFVCASDFSPEAASALEWAGALASREGGRIDLVHVLPEPTRDSVALATDAATFEAARLQDARQRLAQAAEAAARAAGVPVVPQILTGEPDTCIVTHARLHHARMIVMGACGRPAVERWVLGSVAERTVRSATCPVVIVPRLEPGQIALSAANGGTARPLRALVGLEGDDGADLVTFCTDLRRREPCDVTFLHLYWPVAQYDRIGLRGVRDPLVPDPDVVRNLEPKLRSRIGGLPGHGSVTLQIRPAWGEPAANLLLAVDEQPYDLLIVGAHHRHGLSRLFARSVAERLAHLAARTPIVCVPSARPGSAERPSARAAAVPCILTVLAPTDLSDIGNAAIPHAYALLRGTGGVVELVHVHEHGLPKPAYAYDEPARITKAERAAIEKKLRALVPAEADALGITTHVSVIDGGKAAETIVQAAERLNVDAISLASHGRGGLARVLLASVAEEVVRRANRPVVVVRHRAA
jgi:nucleotide-binding universal stress UspA family protein